MINQTTLEKLKKIKLAVFDIDGVFTDGGLIFADDGREYKQFNVQDGLGLKLLQRSGVDIAIITSRQSNIVTNRMQELGIKYVYQGQNNKLVAYEKLKKKLQLHDDDIVYIGDDLPDLIIMRHAMGITVANGHPMVKQYAEWVSSKSGGHGAVREICELIMQTQNTYQSTINRYLED